MASDNIKDNFLYLAPVANSGLLSYIKHSSIGNVPAETITTLVALIQLETPLYKHCTQGCVPRPKGTQIFLNRIKVFIMFTVQLQTLPELPASKKNMFPMSPGHCDCVQKAVFFNEFAQICIVQIGQNCNLYICIFGWLKRQMGGQIMYTQP